MKLLRINDNSSIRKEAFFQIPELEKCIADKTLEQLEKEGMFVFPELIRDVDDLTKNQMILQSYNECYRTGNVMGFLGMGDERMVVSSRFGKDDNDYLFQFFLEKVLDFPNIINHETNINQNNQMLHMLLFLFPYFLKKAERKGIFKKYIYNKYNNGNVRGTIDIARHIKHNVPFLGEIAYNQREYSYDNELTELIRHTVEYIKSKSYGTVLLSKVKEEVKLVVDATQNYQISDRRKIIEVNKKNIVRHAYFHEYRGLQTICILILQNQKQQMGLGNRKAYGILFDGAWLWEEYLNTLIGDIFYHPMNKSGKGAEWLFTSFGGNKTGPIYPDFIGRKNENRVIADAKYKPQENIRNKDYLQMLAYMFRFEAKQGLYLYPEAGDIEESDFYMNRGLSCEAEVRTRDDTIVTKRGLKIPGNTSSYEEFTKEMKASEAAFKRDIFNCFH